MKPSVALKRWVTVVAVLIVLAAVLFWLRHELKISERHHDFMMSELVLEEAQLELHQDGNFERKSGLMTVYPYTNHVFFGGTNYQCELAVKFAVGVSYLGDEGFLTITTNQVFVWIDKTKGVIPVGRVGEAQRLPPGF
jgi:hypothetical protein